MYSSLHTSTKHFTLGFADDGIAYVLGDDGSFHPLEGQDLPKVQKIKQSLMTFLSTA